VADGDNAIAITITNETKQKLYDPDSFCFYAGGKCDCEHVTGTIDGYRVIYLKVQRFEFISKLNIIYKSFISLFR